MNQGMLHQMCRDNRSLRRFRQLPAPTYEQLSLWIDNARMCPSRKNLQPLRYRIVNLPDEMENLFPLLGWAGYLKDWNGPAEGERPTSYIVICCDTSLCTVEEASIDLGIAAQTIMLSSTEFNFGGCMIQSFDPSKVSQVLQIPEGLTPMLVLALGRPDEDVRMVAVKEDGDIKYWRNDNQVHYVPLRTMEQILIPAKHI